MIQPSDFQRESYRIDQQIWDAIALRAGESALFVGIAADGAWIARALEIGVDVSVIGSDDEAIDRISRLGATPLRGSATMIPAKENAFDVAVAFHHLHEVDPGFHAQIVQELARVGRRVVIVEPSPPADPLGRRIAGLYARAKREAGLFEQYQPIEYWRKLLAIVKAEVWQSLITFTRVPPKHAVAETVSLVLEAMAIEDLPEEYLDELRALSRRPDAQLLPLSRIVLVGTTAGEALPVGDGSQFRPDVDLAPPPPPSVEPVPIASAPPPRAPIAPVQRPADPYAGAIGLTTGGAPIFGRPDEAEFPPVLPPPSGAALPPAAPQAPPAPLQEPAAPFGSPFAVPEDDERETPFGGVRGNEGSTPGGFGWSWEPPEEENGGEKTP